MNIRLIIAIILVLIIGVAAWFWYASFLPSKTQYTNNQNTAQDSNNGSAFDTTAAISHDLNSIPDDSSIGDSVKLIDSSVSSF